MSGVGWQWGNGTMHLSSSELIQLSHLKRKSPEERFEMMLQLIHAQLQAMKAGLKHIHKTSDEKELQCYLQKKMQVIYSLKP